MNTANFCLNPAKDVVTIKQAEGKSIAVYNSIAVRIIVKIHTDEGVIDRKLIKE